MSKKCFRKKGGHKKFYAQKGIGFNELIQVLHLLGKRTEKENDNEAGPSCNSAGPSSDRPEEEVEVPEEHMQDRNVDEPSEYIWAKMKFTKFKKFTKHAGKWKHSKPGELEHLINALIRVYAGGKTIVPDEADTTLKANEVNIDNALVELWPLKRKFKKFAKHQKKWKHKHCNKRELVHMLNDLLARTIKEANHPDVHDASTSNGSSASVMGVEEVGKNTQNGSSGERMEQSDGLQSQGGQWQCGNLNNGDEIVEQQEKSSAETEQLGQGRNDTNRPGQPLSQGNPQEEQSQCNATNGSTQLPEHLYSLFKLTRAKMFAKQERKRKWKDGKHFKHGVKKLKKCKKEKFFFKNGKHMNKGQEY